MAHKGERKTRSARPERIPKLGRYVIVTDTDETEKNYFEGLKANLPEASRNQLEIVVRKCTTQELVKRPAKRCCARLNMLRLSLSSTVTMSGILIRSFVMRKNKIFLLVGQTPVLKSGCTPTLVKCRRQMFPKPASRNFHALLWKGAEANMPKVIKGFMRS